LPQHFGGLGPQPKSGSTAALGVGTASLPIVSFRELAPSQEKIRAATQEAFSNELRLHDEASEKSADNLLNLVTSPGVQPSRACLEGFMQCANIYSNVERKDDARECLQQARDLYSALELQEPLLKLRFKFLDLVINSKDDNASWGEFTKSSLDLRSLASEMESRERSPDENYDLVCFHQGIAWGFYHLSDTRSASVNYAKAYEFARDNFKEDPLFVVSIGRGLRISQVAFGEYENEYLSFQSLQQMLMEAGETNTSLYVTLICEHAEVALDQLQQLKVHDDGISVFAHILEELNDGFASLAETENPDPKLLNTLIRHVTCLSGSREGFSRTQELLEKCFMLAHERKMTGVSTDVRLMHFVAETLYNHGNSDEALGYIHVAFKQMQRNPDQFPCKYSTFGSEVAYDFHQYSFVSGKFPEALEGAEALIEISETLDPEGFGIGEKSVAYLCAANAHAMLSHHAEAITFGMKALELYKIGIQRPGEAAHSLLVSLSKTCMETGDYSVADELLTVAKTFVSPKKYPAKTFQADLIRAAAKLNSGDYEEAEQILDFCEKRLQNKKAPLHEEATPMDLRKFKASMEHGYGLLALARGNSEDAIEHFGLGLKEANACYLEGNALHAALYYGLGRAQEDCVFIDEARTSYLKSLEIFEAHSSLNQRRIDVCSALLRISIDPNEAEKRTAWNKDIARTKAYIAGLPSRQELGSAVEFFLAENDED